jgi:hypothetical protein
MQPSFKKRTHQRHGNEYNTADNLGVHRNSRGKKIAMAHRRTFTEKFHYPTSEFIAMHIDYNVSSVSNGENFNEIVYDESR